jgi:hypothetical protein
MGNRSTTGDTRAAGSAGRGSAMDSTRSDAVARAPRSDRN